MADNSSEKKDVGRRSSSQQARSSPPIIQLPVADSLDPRLFVPRRRTGARTCNAFMIYRKVYFSELARLSHRFKMTDVSRWASEAWAREDPEVKSQYRSFANRVEGLHFETWRSIELAVEDACAAAPDKAQKTASIVPARDDKVVSDTNQSSQTMLLDPPIISSQPPTGLANDSFLYSLGGASASLNSALFLPSPSEQADVRGSSAASSSGNSSLVQHVTQSESFQPLCLSSPFDDLTIDWSATSTTGDGDYGWYPNAVSGQDSILGYPTSVAPAAGSSGAAPPM